METPCINICTLDSQRRYCTGCFRTIEEIAGWARLTVEQRRRVIDELPSRATKVLK